VARPTHADRHVYRPIVDQSFVADLHAERAYSAQSKLFRPLD
jgi:hypothetical protein